MEKQKSKTRNQVLKQLVKDTTDDKIVWEVDELNDDYIRVYYTLQLTPKKKIVNKIVYFLNNPKKTTLKINLEIEGTGFQGMAVTIIPIMQLGGGLRGERKTIQDILRILLQKDEEKQKKEKEIMNEKSFKKI